MSDWRTMYQSILADAGRRGAPSTQDLDDVKRAICDAMLDLSHGDDFFPNHRTVEFTISNFSNTTTDTPLGVGDLSLLILQVPLGVRIRYILRDVMHYLDDESDAGVGPYVFRNEIERVSRETLELCRSGSEDPDYPRIFACTGQMLELWPPPIASAATFFDRVRAEAVIAEETVVALHSGAAWIFQTRPTGIAVTETFSGYLFREGYQYLKAYAEYKLWSNLWNSPANAEQAMIRHRAARAVLVDQTTRREGPRYVSPMELY